MFFMYQADILIMTTVSSRMCETIFYVNAKFSENYK